MGDPDVVIHPSAEVLAAAVAARLITAVADVQATGRAPAVVLTGGGIGIDTLEQLRTSPARDAVDWSGLDVYFGDERFVGSDDPERNELQARAALLDHVPVDPARVHPMPAADGPYGHDAAAAADGYARVLAAHAAGDAAVPAFDVLMLGIGGDGHTASLFPGDAAVHATDPVVAVHHSPKPPPTRLSLTVPAIGRAREVWFLAAGSEKADAVARALGGAPAHEVPAAAVAGTSRTRWLIDADAATQL